MGTFALDSLILCLWVKNGLILRGYFLLMTLKKMTVWFWVILKMNKIDKTSLTDQTKIILNEISRIEIYFNSGINQRTSWIKKLSKYVTAFDYTDKMSIVLSATSGGVCIISSVSVVKAPVGTAGASFTLIFSLTTGIIKKYTKHIKKQEEKALLAFYGG